jgi:hypothetical protein
MSKQMTSTTTQFIRQFLLAELAASTIPDWLTSDVHAECIKVLPHIRGQRPPHLGGATSVGASGDDIGLPPMGGGRTGWGRLCVGDTVTITITINLSGVIFIIRNEATMRRSSLMDVEPAMRCVGCGAEEPMRCAACAM